MVPAKEADTKEDLWWRRVWRTLFCASSSTQALEAPSRAESARSETVGPNGLCSVHSGAAENKVHSWWAALGTKWECGCTGIDLYTDFVKTKDECLPWTRWQLQRRRGKRQAKACVSWPGGTLGDQWDAYEENLQPPSPGGEEGKRQWRKMYPQCHRHPFQNS